MKTISKILTSVSLSMLSLAAVGQNEFNALSPTMPVTGTVKGSPRSISMKRPKPANGLLNYAFLDYVYSDSVVATGNGVNYTGGNGAWQAQLLNSRYTLADTGMPNTNPYTLLEAIVAFDTLFDANSFTGVNSREVNSLTVDSISVLFGQQNLSGTNDTLIVQIVDTSGSYNGLPGNVVLYTDTIIQDTGISYMDSYRYGYYLNIAPHTAIPGNGHFAVSIRYYGSKLDTFAFYYGFPSYTCGAYTVADTTAFGYKFGSAGSKTVANSFTWGYTNLLPDNEKGLYIAEVPSAQNGGLSYANCGTTYWQDIAIYAQVSFNNTTGVNSIAESGLSVNQNYPNPFDKQTQITYNLTQSSDVIFTVCDITGRELMNTVYANSTPGQHEINLSANTFSPGVYFYTFKVNGSELTKKMIITE